MAKQKTPKPSQEALFIVNLEELIPSERGKDGKITLSSPMSFGLFWCPGQPANKLDARVHRKHELNEQRYDLLMSERDGLAILGVYTQLYRHIGIGRRRAMRGWLVNSQYRPATAREVAGMIHVPDVQLVGRALRVLTKIGMLRSFRLPDLRGLDELDRQSYPPELTGQALAETSHNIDHDGPAQQDFAFRHDGEAQSEEERVKAEDIEQCPGATTDPRVQSLGEGGHPPPDPQKSFEPGSKPGAKGVTYNVNTDDGKPGDQPRRKPAASGCGSDQETKNPAPAAPSPEGDDETGDAPPAAPSAVDDGRRQTEAQEPPCGSDGATDDEADTEHAPRSEQPQKPKPGATKPTEADAPQRGPNGKPSIAGQEYHSPSQARYIFSILYPDDQVVKEQCGLWNKTRREKGTIPKIRGEEEFRRTELHCFESVFDRILYDLDKVEAARFIISAARHAADVVADDLVRAGRVKRRYVRGRTWSQRIGKKISKIRQEKGLDEQRAS